MKLMKAGVVKTCEVLGGKGYAYVECAYWKELVASALVTWYSAA